MRTEPPMISPNRDGLRGGLMLKFAHWPCRLSFGRRIGAGVLATLLVLSEDRAHAKECPQVADFAVRVYPVRGEVARNTTIGVEEMQRMAGPSAAKHFPLLGMAGGAFSAALVVDASTAEIGPDLVCAIPRLIKVRIGYVDRTVFIAKEAADDACLYKETLEHELRHARIYDEVVDAFVPIVTDQIKISVKQVRLHPEPSAATAETRLRHQIAVPVNAVIKDLKEENNKRQAEVDSPQEVARLRAACDGRGARLAKQGSGL